MEKSTAKRMMDDGIALGMTRNVRDALVERATEVFGQPDATLGVPSVSLLDVRLRLRSEIDSERYEPRWSFVRTSSQGVTRLGSRS